MVVNINSWKSCMKRPRFRAVGEALCYCPICGDAEATVSRVENKPICVQLQLVCRTCGLYCTSVDSWGSQRFDLMREYIERQVDNERAYRFKERLLNY